VSALSPYRTDAQRNRETILRVADEAYSQGSGVVRLEDIARRARLGRATVYRHFPDRRALGLAVAAAQLRTLRRIVKEEAGHHAFRDVLGFVLSSQVACRPLVRLFRELPVPYQRQHADKLVAVLTPAFRCAQAEGRLRGDLEPTDLVLVFEMLETALEVSTARGHRGDPTQRIISVILDGFFGPRDAVPHPNT
jgi:AcrR family transcriptional regulator